LDKLKAKLLTEEKRLETDTSETSTALKLKPRATNQRGSKDARSRDLQMMTSQMKIGVRNNRKMSSASTVVGRGISAENVQAKETAGQDK
jgi:hypothetical protein